MLEAALSLVWKVIRNLNNLIVRYSSLAGDGVAKRAVSETFGRCRSLRRFIKFDQARNEG